MVTKQFRTLLALHCAAALLTLAACGGHEPATSPAPSSGSAAQFSNASLNGQYAVSIGDIASLHFDGQGHIDPKRSSVYGIQVYSGVTPAVPASGTYKINPDGRGVAKIQYEYFSEITGKTYPLSRVLSFVMLKNGDAAFAEMDDIVFVSDYVSAGIHEPSSGYLKKQDPSAFSASAIQGRYVYGATAYDAGWFTRNGVGTITGYGETDGPFSATGSTPPDPVTGALQYPSSFGAPLGLAMFIVNDSELLAGPIPQPLGFPSGFSPKAADNVSAGSFSGRYVLYDQVETYIEYPVDGALANIFVVRGGLVDADGVGSLHGVEDVISTNSAIPSETNQTVSGDFTLDSTGVGTMDFDIGVDLYAAGSEELMFITQGGNSLPFGGYSSGALMAQEKHTYSRSSLTGDYAVRIDGGQLANTPLVMLAKLSFDGTGSVQGIADQNINGSYIANDIALQGSYSVAANGRGTMKLTSFRGTSNYTIYLISPSKFVLIGLQEGDPVSGMGEQ